MVYSPKHFHVCEECGKGYENNVERRSVCLDCKQKKRDTDVVHKALVCKRCGVPHIFETIPEYAIIQKPNTFDEEIFYLCVWCAEDLKRFMNGWPNKKERE